MIREMYFVVAFYENKRQLAELRILSGPHATLEEAQSVQETVWAKRLDMSYFVTRVNLNIELIFFKK